MATATAPAPAQEPDGIVTTLRGVDWESYCKLRDDPLNDHLRMDYLDGDLTIMSPDPIHEEAADLLALVVPGDDRRLWGRDQGGCGRQHSGEGPPRARGAGKIPTTRSTSAPTSSRWPAFASSGRPDRGRKSKLDLDVDRPPDLAIEVDHSRDSAGSLPTYARLGVPEVWRYDVEADAFRFFRLAPDGYAEVDRSVVLPRLTPELVIRALDLLDAMPAYDEVAYLDQVRGLGEGPCPCRREAPAEIVPDEGRSIFPTIL